MHTEEYQAAIVLRWSWRGENYAHWRILSCCCHQVVSQRWELCTLKNIEISLSSQYPWYFKWHFSLSDILFLLIFCFSDISFLMKFYFYYHYRDYQHYRHYHHYCHYSHYHWYFKWHFSLSDILFLVSFYLKWHIFKSSILFLVTF